MTDYPEEMYGGKPRGWHTQRILDVYKRMPKSPEDDPPKQAPQLQFRRRRVVNASLNAGKINGKQDADRT